MDSIDRLRQQRIHTLTLGLHSMVYTTTQYYTQKNSGWDSPLLLFKSKENWLLVESQGVQPLVAPASIPRFSFSNNSVGIAYLAEVLAWILSLHAVLFRLAEAKLCAQSPFLRVVSRDQSLWHFY